MVVSAADSGANIEGAPESTAAHAIGSGPQSADNAPAEISAEFVDGTVSSAKNTDAEYRDGEFGKIDLAMSSPEHGSRRGRTPSRRDFLSQRKALLPRRSASTRESFAPEIGGSKGQVVAKHTALVSVNADAWMASDPDPVDAVVSNLFDAGDKVCIIGPSKSFKTFFTLQLTMSIAAGREFLTWDIPKPRRVLMVQLEVKGTHFHGRVRKVWSAMDISTLHSRLEVVNGRGMDVVVSKIAAKSKEMDAEVVVIDPIYKLLKGDENSARDWKPLLAGFDQLAETGVAVVYVHHDAKGAAGDRQAQDRGAGSGILARDYDCALTITPHATGGALKVIEAIKRNYPSEPAFTAVWEDGIFELSDKAPLAMTSRSSNKNPTTDQPLEDFLEHVSDCLGEAESGVLNKGSLTEAVRVSAGLTKPRSKQLIELAVEQDVIVTNHGLGLSRKQMLYAIDQVHLDTEIERLNAKTAGKQ